MCYMEHLSLSLHVCMPCDTARGGIHSFVDGASVCFHVLATVNNGAVNTGSMCLFRLEFSPFLDIWPGVGLLDHMVALVLVLEGTSILFSTMASSIYIPTHSVRVFPFLHICFQFSSVTQSCLTLCDPMNCSMPGLPVHHQRPEFTQIHIHWVRDAIQLFHPLSSPSPPTPNPSQHQGLFQWVNSLHQVAKVLEFQL